MALGKDDTIPEFNGNKECAWAAMTEAQDPEVDMNCAVEAKPAPMEDPIALMGNDVMVVPAVIGPKPMLPADGCRTPPIPLP